MGAPPASTRTRARPELTAPLMTVDEVASTLRVGRRFVYRLMEQGRLPWVMVGKRRRLRREDVIALLGEGE